MTEETNTMINAFFPNIFDEIVICNSFWDGKKMEKYEVCAQHGAVALIDDSVEHCVAAAVNGLKGLLFGNYRYQILFFF